MAALERRAHPLEDVGRRKQPRDRLKPARQHRERVENGGDRLQQEGSAPDDRFGGVSETQDDRHRAHSHGPTEQENAREVGEQSRSEAEQVERVKEPGEDPQHRRRKDRPDHSEQARCEHDFADPHRSDEDIQQVADPDFFGQRERDRLLRAVENVPEDESPEQEEDGLRSADLPEVDAHEPPDQQIHDRPEEDLHRAGEAAPVQVQVAQEQGGDAAPHRQSSSRPPRAIVMKTFSSDSESARSRISRGVPCATSFPCERKITRSHTSSISRMLCDV